ncbi:MAG: hypothetical protein R3B54_16915 [Bdellovibrionota bacterium]
MLTLVLLIPPIIGFAYFLDAMKQLADVHELLLVASLNCDHRVFALRGLSQDLGVLTLCLGLHCYSSILRKRYFEFHHDGMELPLSRRMVLLLAYHTNGGGLMAYVCFYAKTCTHDTWPERVSNWSLSFVALGLYSLSIKILVPVLFAAFSGNAVVRPVWDHWWALYFISAFFCRQHTKLSYILLSALATVRILVVAVEIYHSYLNMRSGFWELSLLANQLTVLGFFVWFGEVLARRQTRSLFLTTHPDTQ